ncbi:MAG: ATPase, T2SS/T4P/T4SS family [Porcipelethomonas sp.]
MIRKYNLKKLVPYFSEKIGQAVMKISPSDADRINEIRLRSKRPVSVSVAEGEFFLSRSGGFTVNESLAVIADTEDIERSFSAVCDYSVHSYKREISEGFVTLEGGNRVGICGTAVTENGQTSTLKYISGLNFRISGQAFGCADEICRRFFSDRLCSMLIIGPPSCGKTTLLRDMCRNLGDRYRISVIDERGEIGAVYHGVPQNSIGNMTDVFDGYPKAQGISAAVRVMSPQIVVCDEIGGQEDCEAIMDSAVCGVKIIASVHGFSHNVLLHSRWIRKLAESGLFEYAVVLGDRSDPGKIKYVKKVVDVLC